MAHVKKWGLPSGQKHKENRERKIHPYVYVSPCLAPCHNFPAVVYFFKSSGSSLFVFTSNQWRYSVLLHWSIFAKNEIPKNFAFICLILSTINQAGIAILPIYVEETRIVQLSKMPKVPE